MIDSLLSLLQLSDSALPIGGYSHSFGLETWVQKDIVRDFQTTQTAIEILLRRGLSTADGAACALAFNAAAAKDVPQGEKINAYLDATKWSKELHSASLQMGERLKALAINAGWLKELPIQNCHHAVAFGWLGSAVGADLEQTVSSFLYACCASMVSACVRLVPLGHTDGQRLLTALRQEIPEQARIAMATNLDELGGFAPLHEWAAVEHEQLYSRLFQS